MMHARHLESYEVLLECYDKEIMEVLNEVICCEWKLKAMLCLEYLIGQHLLYQIACQCRHSHSLPKTWQNKIALTVISLTDKRAEILLTSHRSSS